MSDEELRRHLSTSVPEHGDGFWEGLERRLAAVSRPELRVVPDLPQAGSAGSVTGVVMPGPAGPEIPEIVAPQGEEPEDPTRPRGVGEPIGPPERTAQLSAETPWGAKDMSFQKDPSDEAQPTTRQKPGWTKLAVAAAAVVVVGGLAFGAERGGMLSTSRVSWMESGDGSTPAAKTTNAVSNLTENLPKPDKLPVVPEVTSAAKSAASSLPKVGTKCDPVPANPTCVCPDKGDCLTGLAVGAVNKVTAAVSVNLNTAVSLVTATKTTVLGVPEKALEWKDKLGLDVALVTKETVKDPTGAVVKVVYRVYVCAQLGTTVKLIGQTAQEGAALALNLLQIKDVNQDGVAEVVVCLVTEATSKLAPVTMTLHDLVGGKDLTVQGTGLPETVFSALSPAQLLAVPSTLLAPVISSVPVAGGWPTGSYTDALGIINQYLH